MLSPSMQPFRSPNYKTSEKFVSPLLHSIHKCIPIGSHFKRRNEQSYGVLCYHLLCLTHHHLHYSNSQLCLTAAMMGPHNPFSMGQSGTLKWKLYATSSHVKYSHDLCTGFTGWFHSPWPHYLPFPSVSISHTRPC